MAQISLCNVTKVYPNGIRAVNTMSLGIENKEFMVLLGPSGCGKTTVLRMIAGLEDVTEGKIYIGKHLVNNMPARERDVAMVFQNYVLYPHMSVYENLAFGLRLRRYPPKEIKNRVLEAAKILGIEGLLERYPNQLSGGERQRVALGRAIARKPMVFLFDEPLSNLDAGLRVQMRTEIHKLHIRLRTTMLYVTHDQIEAMTLGDRIAVMKDGEILQIDKPDVIYERPSNKFVAGFVGTPPMNFFYGRIIKKERGLYFDEGSFQVRVTDAKAKDLDSYAGKDIYMGIRPEHIYERVFVSEVPPDNVFKALLEVVEPMGTEVHLHLRTQKSTFVAKLPKTQRPSAGQDIELVLDMSKAYFFDTKSEINVA